MQRNHERGVAILNSGAMHILDFWVRVIPQHSGAAILNSGVPTTLNLRYGRTNEIMRMISISWKISKSGATTVRAQSRTLYARPRDSIAIPASLMRGDLASNEQSRSKSTGTDQGMGKLQILSPGKSKTTGKRTGTHPKLVEE